MFLRKFIGLMTWCYDLTSPIFLYCYRTNSLVIGYVYLLSEGRAALLSAVRSDTTGRGEDSTLRSTQDYRVKVKEGLQYNLCSGQLWTVLSSRSQVQSGGKHTPPQQLIGETKANSCDFLTRSRVIPGRTWRHHQI